MKSWVVPVTAVLVIGCSGPKDFESIPDDRIGLVEADVLEVPVPPPVRNEGAEPGESEPSARYSTQHPPVVTHAIADFLPIGLDENACVECHAVDERADGGPTPIPASHYTDLRAEPDKRGPVVVGARWNCVACHVERTDAQPLVANTFVP